MTNADSTKLRERQQNIRRLMEGQSEGAIEEAIRREIGCSGPVKLPPERKRTPAPQYPNFVFVDYAKRPRLADGGRDQF